MYFCPLVGMGLLQYSGSGVTNTGYISHQKTQKRCFGSSTTTENGVVVKLRMGFEEPILSPEVNSQRPRLCV